VTLLCDAAQVIERFTGHDIAMLRQGPEERRREPD
jgi:hypothetical protein